MSSENSAEGSDGDWRGNLERTSNYSEDDEYSDYYNEELFDWARQHEDLECLRRMRKSGALEEEEAAEIWEPLATAAKACRESGRKIRRDVPEISEEVDHTPVVQGRPVLTCPVDASTGMGAADPAYEGASAATEYIPDNPAAGPASRLRQCGLEQEQQAISGDGGNIVAAGQTVGSPHPRDPTAAGTFGQGPSSSAAKPHDRLGQKIKQNSN